MTSEPGGLVREIAWRELCPWTLLFRIHREAVSTQNLLLAFIGAWLLWMGWGAINGLLLSDESRARPAVVRYLIAVGDWPGSISTSARGTIAAAEAAAATSTTLPTIPPVDPALDAPAAEATPSIEAAPPVAPAPPAAPARPVTPALTPIAVWWHDWFLGTPLYVLVEPVRRWFDATLSWSQWSFFLIGGFWNLVVWGLLGGAIVRTAVVRFGRDERVGLRESLTFAGRKLPSLLGAPLMPLAAIFGLGIPLLVLGLLMRLNLGVALGGLVWIPVALLGFCMALFAIGLMFGWPLMWGAICAEGSDAFDGISRSYAYTYQRPLQYLAYFLVALVLGILGWLLVGLFCQVIVQLALLAVGAGAGDARMNELLGLLAGTGSSDSSLVRFGVALIGFVNRCVLGLQVAFAYSFVWCAVAAIYLLLRRDADQTELEDVYLDEEAGVSYGLPPLSLDETGVPGADPDGDAALAEKVNPT
jgi:hypothetical protein